MSLIYAYILTNTKNIMTKKGLIEEYKHFFNVVMWKDLQLSQKMIQYLFMLKPLSKGRYKSDFTYKGNFPESCSK